MTTTTEWVPPRFECTTESVDGAPPITFVFCGDTFEATLAGAKLYGEAEGNGAARIRLTDAAGEILADVTAHQRAHRNATENATDISSALLWSHWRFSEAVKRAQPGDS